MARCACIRADHDGVGGKPAIVSADNRLSVVLVDDLAGLFVLILEAESPPAVVNGVGSILPWPDVMRAIGQVAGVGTDIETIAPDAAMSLGGIAMYLPMDMAVSGDLAHKELRWETRALNTSDVE